MEQIKQILQNNIFSTNEEFKRIFHGRGICYGEKYKSITIDSIDSILLICLFEAIDFEQELITYIKQLIITSKYKTIVLQRRYKAQSTSEIIYGELSSTVYAIENGLKMQLNLLDNQNSGYFADMKKGREYIASIAKDKNILNLFSYTCGFSIVALNGDAKSITNVDMSKSALTIGRKNHHINNLSTNNIFFMPYNILKSFSRIKKNAPYDIIIIDPPSFQKGSFIATNDYVKIIKKLHLLANDSCIVLACLNAPELNSQFLINLFLEYAPHFRYEKKLDNLPEFCVKNEEKSLKNLIFIKK